MLVFVSVDEGYGPTSSESHEGAGGVAQFPGAILSMLG